MFKIKIGTNGLENNNFENIKELNASEFCIYLFMLQNSIYRSERKYSSNTLSVPYEVCRTLLNFEVNRRSNVSLLSSNVLVPCIATGTRSK